MTHPMTPALPYGDLRRQTAERTPETRSTTTHRSYDGFHLSTSEVIRPRTAAEVARALREAARRGRRVVVRGAGLSLDRHSASDDLTLSTAHLDHIELDVDAARLTAGPGATWGAILDATAPHGLVPACMPTAPDLTVGGTLATNALSRFSCSQGQESASVESLEVALLDGTVRRCSRTHDAELFFGVIGGLGQLGVVVSATYRLLRRAPADAGPLQVATVLVKQRGLDDIEAQLSPDPTAPDRTAYVAFALGRRGPKQIRCRSHYTVGEAPAPLVIPTGPSPIRKLLEVAIQRVPLMGRLIWNVGYHLALRAEMHLVDELRGFTFFMAPNLWARRRLAARGRVMRILEQTYVVPRGTLRAFLDTLAADCRRAGLDPALFDVVWLPPEDDVLLSSARGGGFAVNIAFAGVDRPAREAAVRGVFAAWTERCAALGGRVHLTKNVIGDPRTLRRMYAPQLDAFLALKARHDPRGLLGSDFLDRVFGLRRTPAGLMPAELLAAA